MTLFSNEPLESLSSKAIQGTLWAYLSFILGKLLTFVSTIILARLLIPEDFGVMGYCLVAVQYLEIINTFGLGVAIISRRDRLEEAANASFIISVLLSLLLYGGAWMLSPLVATFFNSAEVIYLFRVLAVVLPINALGVVPGALIQKELRFRDKVIPDVGRSLAKGLISIVLALGGFGVWSLVWGQIAGETATTITFWLIGRWRPTFRFHPLVTREILGYGGNIISIGLIGALLTNVDYLFVGRILGAAALGYYTLAYRVPELVIRNINVVISKVALPVLSKLQVDLHQLRSVYFSYLRYTSMIIFPAGIGLAILSPQFVLTFYTGKWAPAIPVMQWISLAITLGSVGYIPGVLYKAINHPEILNKLAIIKLPIAISILWYATRWDVTGIALGQVFVACINISLDTYMVSKVIQFPPRRVVKALGPSLVGSSAMALAVGSLNIFLSLTGISGMIVSIAIGIIVYAGVLFIVSRNTMVKAGVMLRNAFGL